MSPIFLSVNSWVTPRYMLFIILLLAGMTNIQFGKLETEKESPPEQRNRAIWNFAKFGEVSRLL